MPQAIAGLISYVYDLEAMIQILWAEVEILGGSRDFQRKFINPDLADTFGVTHPAIASLRR